MAGHWVYAGERHQRLLARETPNVADLCHELRTCRFTNAIHGHDGVEFRQLAGKAQHPGTNGLKFWKLREVVRQLPVPTSWSQSCSRGEELPSDPIADSICLVTRTLRCFLNRGSTCTDRTLRMREWLTDFRSDVIALGGFCHPCFSHSSSLGNKIQLRLAVGSLLIYSNRRFPSPQKENFCLFSVFGHGDPAVALNKFLNIAT